ncbi:MAG TPA: hypothetical protein VNY05_11065 [Candidatus Acidoferrales bacterium]|nr:hypothetical protein [Candidatus Acidoferrales bacterium]
MRNRLILLPQLIRLGGAVVRPLGSGRSSAADRCIGSVSGDVRNVRRRRIEVVRDTKLVDGHASARITRMAIETQRSGRGYLTITEFRPSAAGEGEISEAQAGQ